ncbi:hypothetical protein SADUNF_Sadunf02G0003400 [Salix dunnii]|uniref:AT-hook motif nuclear-localized protein n=1 Tax=Salix dunnii TaxID=1413687 RepID=A0A835N5I8_9ROSI|nr:hypothetical protein SADUNF_Sadunf02G0003400 [Salix dunnii]
MSASETGVMTSRDPFSVTGLQHKTAGPPQPVTQNMRLAFSADGATVYKPITTATTTMAVSPTNQPGGEEGSAAGGAVLSPHGINVGRSGGEPMKRKRGRPRKYGPDGTMALAFASAPQSVAVTQKLSAGLSSPPAQAQVQPLAHTPPPGSDVGVGSPAGAALGGSVSPTGVKKARGRPPGSSKKQKLDALGSAGIGFTPHVITVKAGEHGPRAVCILSANGVISNVTLRQQSTSGGTVTYEVKPYLIDTKSANVITDFDYFKSLLRGIYKTMFELLAVKNNLCGVKFLLYLLMLLLMIRIHESRGFMFMRLSVVYWRQFCPCWLWFGHLSPNSSLAVSFKIFCSFSMQGRFEILALSGSYLPSENGGPRSRTGGLSVCLSGPDGRVLGGSVAGLLMAAAPVQVVVSSFIADCRKESKSANHMEPSPATSKVPPTGGSTGVSSPFSRETVSESSGGPGSPLNQSTGACNNNNPQGKHAMEINPFSLRFD